jgi:hypothetical protein
MAAFRSVGFGVVVLRLFCIIQSLHSSIAILEITRFPTVLKREPSTGYRHRQYCRKQQILRRVADKQAPSERSQEKCDNKQ